MYRALARGHAPAARIAAVTVARCLGGARFPSSTEGCFNCKDSGCGTGEDTTAAGVVNIRTSTFACLKDTVVRDGEAQLALYWVPDLGVLVEVPEISKENDVEIVLRRTHQHHGGHILTSPKLDRLAQPHDLHELHRVAQDLVRPEMKGKGNLLAKGDRKNGRNIRRPTKNGQNGVRIGHEEHTSNQCVSLQSLRLLLCVLLVMLGFFVPLSVRNLQMLRGNVLDHENGERADGIYQLLGGDQKLFLLVGVGDECLQQGANVQSPYSSRGVASGLVRTHQHDAGVVLLFGMEILCVPLLQFHVVRRHNVGWARGMRRAVKGRGKRQRKATTGVLSHY
ncbi:hypothetical protein B0H10DRAFT_1970599 [Mycena sp. CBHHK59/15]|nr:hypothetical protein B0H10DRAFT_1970599 [Mycena sp. CBHHK59/15]